MTNIGKHVIATAKSSREGQKGIIVKDYGQMYLVKADELNYPNTYKRDDMEGKYFQLMVANSKILKD